MNFNNKLLLYLKKNIKYFFLVIIAILLLLYNTKIRKDYSIRYQKLTDKVSLKARQEIMYRNAFINIIKTNGIILSDKIIIRDRHNEVIDIRNILFQNKLLVFRFSENACQSCIETILKKLVNYNITQKKSFIILCTYRNKKYFEVFLKRKHFSNLNYYFVMDNICNKLTAIDQDYLPYLFILNKNLEISDLIVMPTENLMLLDTYLENINY